MSKFTPNNSTSLPFGVMSFGKASRFCPTVRHGPGPGAYQTKTLVGTGPAFSFACAEAARHDQVPSRVRHPVRRADDEISKGAQTSNQFNSKRPSHPPGSKTQLMSQCTRSPDISCFCSSSFNLLATLVVSPVSRC